MGTKSDAPRDLGELIDKKIEPVRQNAEASSQSFDANDQLTQVETELLKLSADSAIISSW